MTGHHWAELAYEEGILGGGMTVADWDAFYQQRQEPSYDGDVSVEDTDTSTDKPYEEQFDPDILQEAIDYGLLPGRDHGMWEKYVESRSRT